MCIEKRVQYHGGEFDVIMSHHVIIKKHYRVLMRDRESPLPRSRVLRTGNCDWRMCRDAARMMHSAGTHADI